MSGMLQQWWVRGFRRWLESQFFITFNIENKENMTVCDCPQTVIYCYLISIIPYYFFSHEYKITKINTPAKMDCSDESKGILNTWPDPYTNYMGWNLDMAELCRQGLVGSYTISCWPVEILKKKNVEYTQFCLWGPNYTHPGAVFQCFCFNRVFQPMKWDSSFEYGLCPLHSV